jgi:hypothetical protein
MRNSRGGLGDIPSRGKAGAQPGSAQSRGAKAREEVSGPKSRPFRQRAIAVCRALPWCDPTPKHRGRHEVASVSTCPTAWAGRRCAAQAGPRRGWKCWTLEMAGHLISKGLLEVISNRSAGNGRSPGKPPLPDFQGHFHRHEGSLVGWTSGIPHWRWGGPHSGRLTQSFIRPSRPCRSVSLAASTIPTGCRRQAHPDKFETLRSSTRTEPLVGVLPTKSAARSAIRPSG